PGRRGSRRPSRRRCRWSAARVCRLSSPSPRSARTPSAAVRETPRTPSSGGNAGPWPGSSPSSSRALPQLRPEPFFFEQPFGELEPHQDLAQLRLDAFQLAFLRIDPLLQTLRAAIEKHAPPLFELVRRHLAVTRDCVQRLAPQQPYDEPPLSPRTPL